MILFTLHLAMAVINIIYIFFVFFGEGCHFFG